MKMKTTIYALAAASLMGAAANAQSTATPPVGFHTLQVLGADANGSRYSLVCAGLINPIDVASAAESITDSALTATGAFAGQSYGENPGGATEPAYIAYYVEITDGAEAGAWANITASDDDTLTLDRDLSAAGGTAKFAIRKHVTIGDLFGYANEAGLDPGDQAASADEVSLFSNGLSQVFFYDDTAGFEGWIDAAFNERQNTPIEPQQAVYVQRKVAGNVSFTRAGHVKTGPTKLDINAGYNALANPRAVGSDDNDAPVFTLGTSGLFNAADTVNSVDPGDSPAVADEIIVNEYDANTDIVSFFVYFYDDTVDFEGWINAAFEVKDDVVLDNGKGFLLNRKANLTGTPFVWTVPAEVIAD
ncbi:MAG: hypothetical protein ACI9UA_001989 [Pseudoalteromonas tetraodonis]|jgi:uncharacterized protein (TIGR02597 family)